LFIKQYIDLKEELHFTGFGIDMHCILLTMYCTCSIPNTLFETCMHTYNIYPHSQTTDPPAWEGGVSEWG